ncbi:nucleotide exchange factor GrpE [Mycoplasmatota bacterium]|nr:nucleotide exchange factor GrpE [Mycoplasmatota bacterium]
MGKNEEKVIVEEKVELNQENEDNKDGNQEVNEKDLLIEELEKKLAGLTNELETVKKAAADIVNRNKQIEINNKYASSGLVSKLLVPMSYFEGALKFKSEDESFNNFLKGFEMIYNLLLDSLKSDGLKEINTKVNDSFDPHVHEVTEVVEVDDAKEETILEILQSGYTYKDRVIKPVKVKVSKQKIESNEIEKENDDNENENIIN